MTTQGLGIYSRLAKAAGTLVGKRKRKPKHHPSQLHSSTMAMRVAYLSDLNINNACLIYLQPYMGSFRDDVEMVELVGYNENVDQLVNSEEGDYESTPSSYIATLSSVAIMEKCLVGQLLSQQRSKTILYNDQL